ncbi:hypothetical protein [Psychroserpens mesophilus]|uniref:hypothetical protein n=1 Tax=Psychroserpens mesophilus TaxID=325473 RepID=UPI003D6617F0
MTKQKVRKIYYINRYDSNKRKQVRENTGYEQIIKYSKVFVKVTPNKLISKLLLKLFRKKVPADYIGLTIGEELVLFFKALITGEPVFYLYADKDAFLLPLLKKKFNLKRIKLYGTLHWPKEISHNFSFYKYNLASTFNGIITLSSSLSKLSFNNVEVIPHGINNEYWFNDNHSDFDNYYLIIGVSNRDHKKQIDIINKIIDIDPLARFKVVISHKTIREAYRELPHTEIFETRIGDKDLKYLYLRAKAVILFQNYCLASNVVLESLAMGVPVLTNNVGDISEYLGTEYPLYIDNESDSNKLNMITSSGSFRSKTVNHLLSRRNQFGWSNIAAKTEAFIVQ